MIRIWRYLIFVAVLTLVSSVSAPRSADAAVVSIFKPFGGKVAMWLPEAPGCAVFTAAVCAATLGTICPTVEQLEVAPPNGGTFGILRIDGLTIPGLTYIYQKYFYEAPAVNVVGLSINLCDVCGTADKVPLVSSICKTNAVKKIVGKVCDFVSSSCPVGNLIYKLGTGGIPSL